MSKREFTAIILKLLGIYCLIQSLPLFGYLGMIVNFSRDDRVNLFYSVLAFVIATIPFLVMLLASYILLRYADKLAKILIKEDGGMDITADVRPEELQAIGFSIAAVIIFLMAIPNLIYVIGSLCYFLMSDEFQSIYAVILRGKWSTLLSVVIQMALAVILFFRARGLANFWKRIQIARYEKIQDDQEEP